MSLTRKCFFTSLSKFFAPFTQSTIGNSKISCYLCFTFLTGFKKLNGLLLEFFCVGRLRFAHKILLFLVYHISLPRPSKFGGSPILLPPVDSCISRVSRISACQCSRRALWKEG